MYSNIPRSAAYQQDLLGFIRDKYGIIATGFTQANRGYFGETWRLDAVKAFSCFYALALSAVITLRQTPQAERQSPISTTTPCVAA